MLSSGPIFLVGLPRSGSTLWTNTLRARSDLCVLGEANWLSPWHPDLRTLQRRLGDLGRDQVLRRFIDSLLTEPLPPPLRRGRYFWTTLRELGGTDLRDELVRRLLPSDRRLPTVLSACLDEASRSDSGRRVAVKFPGHPANLTTLLRWFPHARFLHITREPRALAASKTNDPGGTARLRKRHPWAAPLLPTIGAAYATVQYELAARAHVQHRHRSNYRLAHFEDLVASPASTLRELCRFCDLPWDPAMLEPAPAQRSSHGQGRGGGFDASRREAWRGVLHPWQAAAVSLATRGGRRRFGPPTHQPLGR